MPTARLERRARILSGVPRPVPARRWWVSLLKSPWTWAVLVSLIVGFLCWFDMYQMLHRDRPVEGGTVPGVTNLAIKTGAKYAWPTAVVWVALFLWFDRFRKNRIATWIVAFVWGACMSTWISIHVNSWAGELLMIRGDGDPSTGARPAVFVAPFVEELAKSSILLLLAILIRYRLVSMMQAVCLAGLSAIGFAFTENILYYARGFDYATRVIEAGDPEQALMSLVKLRGIYTSFGHPTFTVMIALGLVVGLRHRSKLVRILAPVTGFVLAAGLHMLFNGTASVMQDGDKLKYWLMALAGVVMLAGYLVIHLLRESGKLRARLHDLVRFGWLLPSDPQMFSTLRRRLWMLVIAISQPRRLPATIRLMRSMTELAYLRDSMVLGLIDEVGYERARELLAEIRSARPLAVWTTQGERVKLPQLGRKSAVSPTWGAPMSPPARQQWAPPGG